MNKSLLILALISTVSLFAQKDEKIEYYTDSDVKQHKFYLGATYAPYFVNRRIITSSVGGVDLKTNFLNQGSKGAYGYSIGGNLYYKLNPNFHVSVGVNKSSASFSMDFKDIASNIQGLNGDTISGNWKSTTHVEYINIPIQVLFSYSLSDQWDAEVSPMVEMNIGSKLNRELTVPAGDGYLNFTDPEDQYWQANKENMRDLNWTVGFGLGANYYITPKFSFFFKAHIKYLLRPIVPNEEPAENMIWFGGQTGFRVYF